MRRLFVTLLLLSSPLLASASDSATNLQPAEANAAAKGRVIKVLPLLLDLKHRDALSPSLYDRDAYQLYLRQHTNEISGIRCDVLWNSAHAGDTGLKLRVELLGAGAGDLPGRATLEQTVTPGYFRRWTSLTVEGAEYRKLGALIAWRVTLWSGDRLLGEQKSFLW